MKSKNVGAIVVSSLVAAVLGCASAGTEATVPPGTCVVSSRVGLTTATAYVSGPQSSVRWGLMDTIATLDAAEVRMTKGMMGKPKIGVFEGDLARAQTGFIKEDVAPVVDGRTSAKVGLVTYQFESTGCQPAEVQLAAIHIVALVVSSNTL